MCVCVQAADATEKAGAQHTSCDEGGVAPSVSDCQQQPTQVSDCDQGTDKERPTHHDHGTADDDFLVPNSNITCSNCGHNVQLTPQATKSLTVNLFMTRLLQSDQSCFFYTGVPTVDTLKFIFRWIKGSAEGVTLWGRQKRNLSVKLRGPKQRKMTMFMCLVLTLVRLRKGFDMDHLAFLFGISQSHVSRIFTTWVNVMHQCMKPLLLWPDKTLSLKNLPESFGEFPRTRAIIDCTEVRIEKPFKPAAQKLTWSSYKHSNTGKILVAVMPSGAITYVSKVYVGSVSDKVIVQKSGFLQHVQQGDDIMADRGFNIRELLLKRKATLNIPAFSKGQVLSAKAVQRSRKIASVRIHVERAIGRMKTFKILRGVIPCKMRFLINQMLTVISVLCNLQKRLC